jgi:hypothetical protein
VQRRVRLTNSIEIVLMPVMAFTPVAKTLDGRKGRRRSTSPLELPTFSRSSAFGCGSGIVPDSTICRTISERKLRKSVSACAVSFSVSSVIVGAVALSAAALLFDVFGPLFRDRLGNCLLVEGGLVRFLEFA